MVFANTLKLFERKHWYGFDSLASRVYREIGVHRECTAVVDIHSLLFPPRIYFLQNKRIRG